MKNIGVEVAQLTPDAHGWRLHSGGKTETVASLSDAVSRIPARAVIHLAIPTQMALLERLTLPAVDREELAGMVQLQLEKTVPYPVEEVTSDFEVLSATESESTVVTLAVHAPALTELCAPFREQKRLPQKVTVFGQHAAALCPAGETVLALWEEQEHLVAAICVNGRLAWAQIIPGTDPETLQADLPRFLLSAEMEGVPTNFPKVLLAHDLAQLEPVLRESLELPVERMGLHGPLPPVSTNFVPAEWTVEARGFERVERIRQRLLAAAVIYLLLLAAAFVYLAWTKHRVQALDVQIAQLQPQLDLIEARKSRWDALAPAIDPNRYPVELLYQVNRARPSPDLQITAFTVGLTQFMVEGEAPSAAVAIAYSEKLRTEPDLATFRIEMPNPPAILATERAQFRIFGKL